jgi:hypothetical protein
VLWLELEQQQLLLLQPQLHLPSFLLHCFQRQQALRFLQEQARFPLELQQAQLQQ